MMGNQHSSVELMMPTDVELARFALPASGWSACGVRGRPFVASDLDALSEIGRGDSDFVWERQVKGRGYFEGLLQFRLGHYWKFGFGVHGVWQDYRLVGQCGLQV